MGKKKVNYTDQQIHALTIGEGKIDVKEISLLLGIHERTVKRKLERSLNQKLKEINKTRKAKEKNEDNSWKFEKNEIDNILATSKIQDVLQKNTFNKLVKLLTLSKKLKLEEKSERKNTEKKYSTLIHTIEKAIKSKKKINLPSYNAHISGISNNINVSPVYLDIINEKIYALFNGKKKCYHFKHITGKVSIVKDEKAEFNIDNWDPMAERDAFGIEKSNTNLIKIKILIDVIAYDELLRIYPSFESIKTKIIDSRVYLEFEVVSIIPFAHFFYGMINKITILGNQKAKKLLIEYFNEKIMPGFNRNFNHEE